ncbi:hypothetical protein RAHE111665_16630 [Rariglobus hedericola]
MRAALSWRTWTRRASRWARASASRASWRTWRRCLAGRPPVKTSSAVRPRRSRVAAVAGSSAVSAATRRQPWRGRWTHLPRALRRRATSSAESVESATRRPTVRSNQSWSEPPGAAAKETSISAWSGSPRSEASSGESSTVRSGGRAACHSRNSSGKESLTVRVQESAQPSQLRRKPAVKAALAERAAARSNSMTGSPAIRGGGVPFLAQCQETGAPAQCCSQGGFSERAMSCAWKSRSAPSMAVESQQRR